MTIHYQPQPPFLARRRALWHIASVSESALLLGIVFLFGLIVGSFLNVCIWRIPQDQSIAFPASHCTKCNAPIRPLDNIPVLSWVLLGGKCRDCRAPISPLYPFVELLTGIAFAACVWQFDLTREGAKWAVFLAILIVLFFADIYFRLLPDEVNLFGAIAGLAFSVLIPLQDGTAAWLANRLLGAKLSVASASLADAVLGGSVVALGLWMFAEAYSRLRRRPQMGLGDVKMMAMLGLFLGIKRSYLALLLGTILGSVLGLIAILVCYQIGWKRGVAIRAARRGMGTETALRWTLAQRYQLPLGTFLAVGAAAAVFAAGPILEWYGSFFD